MFLVWGILGPHEPRMPQRALETALRTDLQTMRYAIDSYTLNAQRPPTSLQDLVDAGYIRQIPIDPITRKADWATVVETVEVEPSRLIFGVVDIHSHSSKVSTDGTLYNSW
jgi:general secretion pathway protein G